MKETIVDKIPARLSEGDRRLVGDALQGSLVDLIDLGLSAKHAHWNIVGPRFRQIHLHLDEVVDLAREHADTVAERAAAIGINPDGRAATVASASNSKLGTGYLDENTVVAAMAQLLGEISDRFDTHIKETGEADPVTQDVLIAAARDLEKERWMFEAQQ